MIRLTAEIKQKLQEGERKEGGEILFIVCLPPFSFLSKKARSGTWDLEGGDSRSGGRIVGLTPNLGARRGLLPATRTRT